MKTAIKFVVVAALLASNMTVAFAGPTRGPASGVRRVNARSTMIFHETFRAGEIATVSIAGDGDTDLDIYVFDANGNLITRAIGLSDRETVSFMPVVTSTFRIEVRNLGKVWNEFAIVMR